MRAGFGLVAILVTLGVIIMIMHTYTLPAAKQAIQTRKKVEEQFSMNTPEGMADAQASIVLDDATKGSRFNGLQVTSVVTGGPINKVFDLMAGDQIVAIGGPKLRDPPYNDPEMARAMLYEAKLRQQPLTVIRNGEEIELVAH